jgi:hypothetical protein
MTVGLPDKRIAMRYLVLVVYPYKELLGPNYFYLGKEL